MPSWPPSRLLRTTGTVRGTTPSPTTIPQSRKLIELRLLNLAVSGHRRARRRLAALRRLGPPAPVPPVSVDALALADALQGLTLAHRQVVVLYYLVDLPV